MVNVEVSTSSVTLTLASAVTSSQSVTVSYTPGEMALRQTKGENVGGHPAIPLSSEAVTNESPPNARPLFAWDESGGRRVAEGTAVGRAMGAPLAAGDADGDALTYAISGGDAQYFELDASSGELRTKAALDYESRTEYSLTVSIRDGKDPQNLADSVVDDELDVTVAVTNVDEDCSLTLSSPQPQADIDYTATLSDPDEVLSTSWTWERSTSSSGPWTHVMGPISGGTTSVYQPDADDVSNYLRVSASYTDGHGPNKSLVLRSPNSVRAARLTNNPPIFDTSTTTREIDEDARANAAVGAAVIASDPDQGDVLTYTLTG